MTVIVELTFEQEAELILGPHPNGGTRFASDDERAMAWKTHRAGLLAKFPGVGRRPAAWWMYDAPETKDGYGITQLFAWGEISYAELRRLRGSSAWTEAQIAELVALAPRRQQRAWNEGRDLGDTDRG